MNDRLDYCGECQVVVPIDDVDLVVCHDGWLYHKSCLRSLDDPAIGLMIRVCAWCGEGLGYRQTDVISQVGESTHGICHPCKERGLDR